MKILGIFSSEVHYLSKIFEANLKLLSLIGSNHQKPDIWTLTQVLEKVQKICETLTLDFEHFDILIIHIRIFRNKKRIPKFKKILVVKNVPIDVINN